MGPGAAWVYDMYVLIDGNNIVCLLHNTNTTEQIVQQIGSFVPVIV
jgi:hypothetical protein